MAVWTGPSPGGGGHRLWVALQQGRQGQQEESLKAVYDGHRGTSRGIAREQGQQTQ
jgi:hypothetical protein